MEGITVPEILVAVVTEDPDRRKFVPYCPVMKALQFEEEWIIILPNLIKNTSLTHNICHTLRAR